MDRFLLLPFVVTQNIAQLCAPPCASALGVACRVALSLQLIGGHVISFRSGHLTSAYAA